MADSKIDNLKQQLLSRLIAGEIDDAEYERLLSRIEQQSTATGSSQHQTDTPADRRASLVSVGDLPTGQYTPPQLASGSTLGKFTVLEQLGQGGMGEAWKAHDTVGERDVVIKVLPPELSRSREELARVKESFRTVHRLNHENICPTHDLSITHKLAHSN